MWFSTSGLLQSQPRHHSAVGVAPAAAGGRLSGDVARQLRQRHEDRSGVRTEVRCVRTSKSTSSDFVSSWCPWDRVKGVGVCMCVWTEVELSTCRKRVLHSSNEISACTKKPRYCAMLFSLTVAVVCCSSHLAADQAQSADGFCTCTCRRVSVVVAGEASYSLVQGLRQRFGHEGTIHGRCCCWRICSNHDLPSWGTPSADFH